jgi:uncharacterized Zn-binding protein involved in type VI secretion
VFVNDLNVVRHTSSTSKGDTVVAGSARVFVNDLQVARLADPMASGVVIATGSNNVFAGRV